MSCLKLRCISTVDQTHWHHECSAGSGVDEVIESTATAYDAVLLCRRAYCICTARRGSSLLFQHDIRKQVCATTACLRLCLHPSDRSVT